MCIPRCVRAMYVEYKAILPTTRWYDTQKASILLPSSWPVYICRVKHYSGSVRDCISHQACMAGCSAVTQDGSICTTNSALACVSLHVCITKILKLCFGICVPVNVISKLIIDIYTRLWRLNVKKKNWSDLQSWHPYTDWPVESYSHDLSAKIQEWYEKYI